MKKESNGSKNDGNGIPKDQETPTTNPGQAGATPVGNPPVAPRIRKQLDEVEQKEFLELDTTIRSGWRTFLQVGTALDIVRKKGFYLVKYDSFEEYALSEYGYSRAYAYSLMDSAEVSTQLSAIADITVVPANEAQCRELIAVPREKREAALLKAIESSGEKPLTAKIIRQAGAEFKPAGNGKPKKRKNAKLPIPDFTQGLTLLGEIEKLVPEGESPLTETIAALRKWLQEQMENAEANSPEGKIAVEEVGVRKKAEPPHVKPKKKSAAKIAPTLWHCCECDATYDEEDTVPLYECIECGTLFTQETSANNNHSCPDCNKFGSKVTDHGCPDCNENELEEVKKNDQVPDSPQE